MKEEILFFSKWSHLPSQMSEQLNVEWSLVSICWAHSSISLHHACLPDVLFQQESMRVLWAQVQTPVQVTQEIQIYVDGGIEKRNVCYEYQSYVGRWCLKSSTSSWGWEQGKLCRNFCNRVRSGLRVRISCGGVYNRSVSWEFKRALLRQAFLRGWMSWNWSVAKKT